MTRLAPQPSFQSGCRKREIVLILRLSNGNWFTVCGITSINIFTIIPDISFWFCIVTISICIALFIPGNCFAIIGISSMATCKWFSRIWFSIVLSAHSISISVWSTINVPRIIIVTSIEVVAICIVIASIVRCNSGNLRTCRNMIVIVVIMIVVIVPISVPVTIVVVIGVMVMVMVPSKVDTKNYVPIAPAYVRAVIANATPR